MAPVDAAATAPVLSPAAAVAALTQWLPPRQEDPRVVAERERLALVDVHRPARLVRAAEAALGCIVLESAGRFLYSCAATGVARRWNMLELSPEDVAYAKGASGLSHQGAVCCAAVSLPQRLMCLPPRPGRVRSQAKAEAAGPRLYTGGEDWCVREWSIHSGRKLRSLEGHTGPVLCLAASPERVLYSGSWDCTVREWRLADGSVRHTYSGHGGPVRAVVVSPDATRLLSASDDRSVRVWDTVARRPVFILVGHTAPVTCLCLLGTRALSGSVDGDVRVWSLPAPPAAASAEESDAAVTVASATDGGGSAAAAEPPSTATLLIDTADVYLRPVSPMGVAWALPALFLLLGWLQLLAFQFSPEVWGPGAMHPLGSLGAAALLRLGCLPGCAPVLLGLLIPAGLGYTGLVLAGVYERLVASHARRARAAQFLATPRPGTNVAAHAVWAYVFACTALLPPVVALLSGAAAAGGEPAAAIFGIACLLPLAAVGARLASVGGDISLLGWAPSTLGPHGTLVPTRASRRAALRANLCVYWAHDRCVGPLLDTAPLRPTLSQHRRAGYVFVVSMAVRVGLGFLAELPLGGHAAAVLGFLGATIVARAAFVSEPFVGALGRRLVRGLFAAPLVPGAAGVLQAFAPAGLGDEGAAYALAGSLCVLAGDVAVLLAAAPAGGHALRALWRDGLAAFRARKAAPVPGAEPAPVRSHMSAISALDFADGRAAPPGAPVAAPAGGVVAAHRVAVEAL